MEVHRDEQVAVTAPLNSGVARGGLGGSPPPIRIEAVFTVVKLLLLNIITSL